MMIWLSLVLIVIGFGGGYVLGDGRLEFVLYHLGGLGATGLLACASAAIAKRKGYGYWRAWLIALFLPLVLGFITAYLAPPGNQGIKPGACGGSVSLGVGIILIVVWSIMKQRKDLIGRPEQEVGQERGRDI